MAIRKRTRARELALQFLYAADVREDGGSLRVDPFLRLQTKDDAIYLFATGLVHGTLEHKSEIDDEIRRVASNWRLERLAAVDRNLLRLAVHELLHRDDIPPQVTINEAIEIAKRFSTAKSGAFVNGILDRVRRDRERLPRGAGAVPADVAPEPEGETTERTIDESVDETADEPEPG